MEGDARAAMFRAGASRCRRLPWSRGGPRPAPRSWVTPARDFVVSAPEESSSASPSAPRGGSVPDALQPPRGSLRPAILVCTSKVVSAETRKDYEAWLVDGKRLIEEVLRDKDCQAGLAVGAGADVQHRFSWVHFPAPSSARARKSPPQSPQADASAHARERLPSVDAAGSASMSHVRHSGAPECETVAVVFQRHDDLERWRHSRRRAAWLERGERFGDDGDGETPFEKKNGRVVMSARASTIDVDDGSLGGWLPADTSSDASSRRSSANSPSPPAAWKVYLAVLLAQYPLVELNALFLLPLMDAVDSLRVVFAPLPQPARMLIVQSWTSFGAVFVTLPAAQAALRKTGFLAGKGESRSPALGVASVAAAYAAAVAAAFAAQPHAAVAVETIAKMSP